MAVGLEFTPLEFETCPTFKFTFIGLVLEFTPLEFETSKSWCKSFASPKLEFTPLEFETYTKRISIQLIDID